MRRFPFWLDEMFWENPWRELEEISSLFDSFTEPRWNTAQAFPPVNVWGDAEKSVLTAEIPGIAPEDLDISVQDKVVTIRGKRSVQELGEEEVWHRRERGYGEFARSVTLPHRVNSEKVEASYTNGVLRVVLPRLEEEKPRRIEVKAA